MNNDATNFSEFTFQVLNQTGGLGHYSFRMVLKLAINQSQPMVIPHKNKTVPRHSTNYQLTLSFGNSQLGMPNDVFLKMVLLFYLKVVDQGYDEIHYILHLV